jgi:hypothetical protein
MFIDMNIIKLNSNPVPTIDLTPAGFWAGRDGVGVSEVNPGDHSFSIFKLF